jgi:hypothetical protein
MAHGLTMIGRPDRTEANEYYFNYIDQVGDGDVRDILERQLDETVSLLASVSEERSLHRYAPDKWTIRQAAGHVNDTERLFTFRAMWFARGFDSPLPSFEQDIAVASAASDDRPWKSHIDEFRAIRGATLQLFRNLPGEAWMRQGVASGKPVTVRALAYITAGHVNHHNRILRERYLSTTDFHR